MYTLTNNASLFSLNGLSWAAALTAPQMGLGGMALVWLHLIVAVFSLFCLTLALKKLMPSGAPSGWQQAPVERGQVAPARCVRA